MRPSRFRCCPDDRNRELASGQEARLLAVVGDQVRLGQALEVAGLLERLDDGADAFLAVEEEQIQEIAEDELVRLSSSKSGAGELLRRRARASKLAS